MKFISNWGLCMFSLKLRAAWASVRAENKRQGGSLAPGSSSHLSLDLHLQETLSSGLKTGGYSDGRLSDVEETICRTFLSLKQT